MVRGHYFKNKFKKAQTLVEFALVFPIFIVLIFFLIDGARYYFVQQTMSHQIRTALRECITFDPANPGEKPGPNPGDPPVPKTRFDIVKAAVLRTNIQKFDIVFNGTASGFNQVAANLNPTNGGDKSEFVTLTMVYPDFFFLTPFVGGLANKKFPVQVSLTFQNEEI